MRRKADVAGAQWAIGLADSGVEFLCAVPVHAVNHGRIQEITGSDEVSEIAYHLDVNYTEAENVALRVERTDLERIGNISWVFATSDH